MPTDPWKEFDCYKVLGIAPTANLDELRTAYRRASMKAHPDAGGTHEAQVRVNHAYEVLSDPVMRQSHDFYWRQASSSAKTGSEAPKWSAWTSAGSTHRPGRTTAKEESRKAEWASSIDALFRRVRKRIDKERQNIREQRTEKVKAAYVAFEKSFQDGMSSRNWRFAIAIILTAVALAATGKGVGLAWIAAGITWVSFISVARGTRIGSQYVSFNDADWKQKISALANAHVDSLATQEEAKLEKHNGYVASLNGLINRSSTFDDSEDQVARRLTAALFLMGYQPKIYDRQTRILVFSDGSQCMLVRFRHRSGAPTNISYVERMLQAMSIYGAQQGFLFCTPGLSGNGASLAKQNGIKWYSLERMNEWINNVVQSEYDGPPGDILSHLEKLMAFIGQISTPLPYRRKWRGYR